MTRKGDTTNGDATNSPRHHGHLPTPRPPAHVCGGGGGPPPPTPLARCTLRRWWLVDPSATRGHRLPRLGVPLPQSRGLREDEALPARSDEGPASGGRTLLR